MSASTTRVLRRQASSQLRLTDVALTPRFGPARRFEHAIVCEKALTKPVARLLRLDIFRSDAIFASLIFSRRSERTPPEGDLVNRRTGIRPCYRHSSTL